MRWKKEEEDMGFIPFLVGFLVMLVGLRQSMLEILTRGYAPNVELLVFVFRGEDGGDAELLKLAKLIYLFD